MLKKLNLVFVCLIAVFCNSGAFALDLNEARINRLIGEMSDGYVGAIGPSPKEEVTKLVAEINAGRRDKYQEISNTTKEDIAAVAISASIKLISNAKQNNYCFKEKDSQAWQMLKDGKIDTCS